MKIVCKGCEYFIPEQFEKGNSYFCIFAPQIMTAAAAPRPKVTLDENQRPVKCKSYTIKGS